MAENPVVRRLAKLTDQWEEFAQNGDARVLVWLVRPDEITYLRTFVAAKGHESDDGPDLFVPLEQAFTSPSAFGLELRASLLRLYDEVRPALEKEGVEATWTPPPLRSAQSDLDALVEALVSFHREGAEPEGVLAVCLDVPSVSDANAYLMWLQKLTFALPPSVRLVLMDEVDRPALGALVKAEPKRVVACAADLDATAALVDIAANAGNLDTPGGQFRLTFAQFAAAASKQDVAAGEAKAREAIAIAAGQSWFHLAATVHLAFAALLSSVGRGPAAIQEYLSAHNAAARCEGETAAFGPRLRMQSRLCLGSTLLTEKAYDHAARAFEDAAAVANELADPVAELDAWRLVSFSHEMGGALDKAWPAAMTGLRIAQTLDDEKRAMSMLPYLCDGIWRMTRNQSHRDYWPSLEPRLLALAGPGWRPGAGQGSAPPAGPSVRKAG